ncbi:LCP family protein [Cellulomonas sp. SLBN-39]|uniref:LCP family protein n=1 Tax=Cellulomonas sp. SLBN-39 TaxID=2768446 RepID=UPI00114DEEDC|nr:LCP family protein [Cellulomonas sp. SLBN-39]
MPDRHAAPARPDGPRHARTLRSRTVLRGLALTVVAVLAFGATSAAAVWVKLYSGVTTVDVSGLVTPIGEEESNDPDDPNAGNDLNILVMGSDQRDGENAALGGDVAGMRSDTTIVMHISADRTRVEMVSIPRDSMVDIPACIVSPDGATTGAEFGQFNAAFAYGADLGGSIEYAAACTIQTVQNNTGVSIDEFVVVDFSGFVQMIDALGGVQMCIPQDIYSEKADNLTLSAGTQTLDGYTALQYARARTGTGLGDGSDTNRLGRQQQLIASIMQSVLSKNMLTDLGQLMTFAQAATSTLTLSPDLASLDTMAGIAYSLRGVRTENMTFMTIPFAAWSENKNRVIWTSEADAIWANMAADVPIVAQPEPAPTQTSAPGGDAGAQPDPGAGTGTDVETPAAPSPSATKTPGKDAFSAADISTSC